VVHSSSHPLMRAAYNAHASHVPKIEEFGESEAEIYQAIQDNGNVQFFANTEDTPDSARPGGLADSILDPVSPFLNASYYNISKLLFFLRYILTTISPLAFMVSSTGVILPIH
jgi:hypothetical protein